MSRENISGYINNKEYRCCQCGKTYEYERSHEECIEEHNKNFGYEPDDCMAIICDDCYQEQKKEHTWLI